MFFRSAEFASRADAYSCPTNIKVALELTGLYDVHFPKLSGYEDAIHMSNMHAFLTFFQGCCDPLHAFECSPALASAT
jgi:hypothetical protein